MKRNKKNTVIIGGKEYHRKQLTLTNGKRKSIYARTKRELNEKVQEFLASGEATRNNRGQTFEEYSAYLLSKIAKKVDHRTYVGYEEKVRLHMLPILGDKLLSSITPDDIDTVMTGLVPYSQSYYKQARTLLQRFFQTAKQNKIIAEDPTEGLEKKGGLKKQELPALTENEIDVLLEAIKGLRVETFCRIGIYCGLRREEILGLKWDAVYLDVEDPYIEVRTAWRTRNNRPEVTTKLKSDAAYRKVPIPAELFEHLVALKKLATSEYVIANDEGGPLSETQWRNLWRQVTRRTTAEHMYTRYKDGKKTVHHVVPTLGNSAKNNPGVKYTIPFTIRPHQLRYTYATMLIASGTDPRTAMYLLGHESLAMTMQVYARVKDTNPAVLATHVNRAFEALDRARAQRKKGDN